MPDFGFGFGSHRSNARFIAGGTGSIVPLVSPSEGWTGTAGTGFVSVPEDPPRTSAKPMLRLIVPPNQFFSDELLVGVIAGANDGGNLLANMGLQHVIVHYEGTQRTISAPSFQTFADANGAYRTYFGWWTLLRHDGRHGHGSVYFDAVPRDTALRRRVVGPFQFSPQPRPHDGTVTVSLGGAGDFRAIGEALAHCRDQRFDNPLVTIIEAGDYDIADIGTAYEGAGYCTIAGAIPGVRISKPAYAGDEAAVLRSRYAGLRFRGANLTIDMRFISQIHSEAGATRSHWLDGCAVVNSAGPGATWRGGVRPVPWMVKDGGWFTECVVSDCGDVFANAKLVRGTTALKGHGELYSGCPAVIGNTSTSHRGDRTLARDVPAMRVRYAGTASSATIELTGAQAAPSRTITVKIAGSPDRSFTLEKSEAAFNARTNYTLANLVAWLNTIPGISATIIDASETRGAAWLSLAGLAGAAFGARDLESGPLTLVTHIGTESVWWRGAGTIENAVLWGNVAIDMVGRVFEFDGSGSKFDLLIANNAVQNDNAASPSPALSSRFDGVNDHLVFAHNTLSTQALTLRTDSSYLPGNRCVLANNSLRAIGWGGAASETSILNNHLRAGESAPASAPGRTNVVGTTIGGNETTLYADDRAGDFSARGELVANPAPAILRYTAIGEQIAAIDVKGARDAPAARQPEPPPSGTTTARTSATHNTVGFAFEETQVGTYADGAPYAIGAVTLTSTTPPSQIVDTTYQPHSAGGTSYPNWPASAWDPNGAGAKLHDTPAWVHGLVVNAGNRSYAGGSTTANSGTVADISFRQGWQQISNAATAAGHPGEFSSTMRYLDSHNKDPGRIGEPLIINSGSLVKAIVRDGQNGRAKPHFSSRDGLDWLGVLSVVPPEDAPTLPNSLRPGIASADMRSHFTSDDWNLSVFLNLPKVAGAKTVDQMIAASKSPTHVHHTMESVNAGNTGPMQHGDSGYARTLIEPLNELMAALHFDYPPADKIKMLNELWCHAIDTHERLMEGGNAKEPNSVNGSNGNPLRGPVMVLVYSALRDRPSYGYPTATAKLAEIRAKIDSFNSLLAEYKVIYPVNGQMIIAGGSRAQAPNPGNRRYDPFDPWMLGVWHWGGPFDNTTNSSYHGTTYLWNVATGGLVSGQALLRIPGAKELWNKDGWFTYHRQIWEREMTTGGSFLRSEGGGQETLNTVQRAMFWALRVPDLVAPVLTGAFVKDDWMRLVFDRPLSENYPHTLSDFTFTKNGQPLTGIVFAPAIENIDNPTLYPVDQYSVRYGVWGTNVGFKLDVPAVYGDVFTVSYNGGSGTTARLRSAVDRVNVAAFGPLTVTNQAPLQDGQNTSFPIVRFTPTDQYRPNPAANLTIPHASRGTYFIKGFKLLASPPANGSIFTTSGGAHAAMFALNADRRFALQFRHGGTFQAAWVTSPLPLDTELDILLSWDIEDPSSATGITSLVGGTSSRGTTTWNGGPGKLIGGTSSSAHLFMNNAPCEMGCFYANFGERITDPTIFSRKTGGVLDIGTNGEGASPTGKQPEIFYVGNAAQINDPSGHQRGSLDYFKIFKFAGPGAVDVASGQSAWR